MTDRIEEIKARCEAATKGPWEVIEKGNSVLSHSVVTVAFDSEPQVNICSGISPRKNNSDFIAHSREDIPYLLDEIERLTKERDAAVEDCNGYCASCKYADDCAKHDRNDSGNADWYYGDCEEWEWRGVQK